MATTMSNSPPRAREKSVSAGRGPWTSRASRRADSAAGVVSRLSSSPKGPSFPPCGFIRPTAIRGPPRLRADLASGQARRVHVAKVETFERAGLEAALPRLRHDVETERRAEQGQRGLHHRAIADDNGATRRGHRGSGQGLGRDLRAHPGRIAHGDADEWWTAGHQAAPRARVKSSSGEPIHPPWSGWEASSRRGRRAGPERARARARHRARVAL